MGSIHLQPPSETAIWPLLRMIWGWIRRLGVGVSIIASLQGETATPGVARSNSASVAPALWSLVPPHLPAIPRDSSDRDAQVSASPIDLYIDARLSANGLRRAPEASRRTLIRRAAWGLTGLPPTVAEVEAYLSDASPDAFERMVDRYLAAPAYGERWARWWLDLARYAAL